MVVFAWFLCVLWVVVFVWALRESAQFPGNDGKDGRFSVQSSSVQIPYVGVSTYFEERRKLNYS
jgi:hypothetical protein